LQFEGKTIKGRQMVDAMNAAGIDLVIFGNHEFDLKETELQQRINESNFQWISSNTFHFQNGKIISFAKEGPGNVSDTFPQAYIRTVSDEDGTTAKIGFIGLTLPFNKAAYVNYADALTSAKTLYNQIKDSVDIVVAITHQSMQEDETLAREIPGLALILGGHEHDQRFEKIGNIRITKAKSNAKSAYIIKLTINKKRHQVKTKPKLEVLDSNIIPDSTTTTIVQKWVKIANDSYASLGFDANEIVLKSGESLEGRETEVRGHSTNLTKLIINAMIKAAPQSEVVIFNAGSIRVDDVLQMPLTQYDVLRTLPFGGGIKEVEIRGGLLVQILDAGLKNRNSGGFLHYNENLHHVDQTGQWLLDGIAIDNNKTYRVALTDFLLTGGEANLAFLKPGNKDIIKEYESDKDADIEREDIRKVIIQYLQTKH
jgi:2',3'-cyclic-nucleotide 2'-phosphodiesterase (5'-nucleotidase family)